MTSIFPSVTETRAGGGAEGGPCSRWSLKCSWPTGVHSTNFVRNIVSGCKGKSLRLALRDTSSPCSAGHPLWHLPEFCSSRLSGQTSGSGKKSTCHSLTSVLSLWDPSIPCKMLLKHLAITNPTNSKPTNTKATAAWSRAELTSCPLHL